MTRSLRFPTIALVACITSSGCLPSDDRPPPGNVTFTVSPSAAVRDGIVTDDGWTLVFSRLVVGIGRTGLSDGCTEYAESRYDRLIDVTKGSGQKLSVIYGLGTCDVRFRIAPPSPDVLLGKGVTEADKLYMGTYAKDPYARSTASVWIEGRATRGDLSERFKWLFRKNFRYTECRREGDAGVRPPIELTENVDTVRDIKIAGEALFREEPKPGARLRFAPFAAADLTFGNADGTVDFDELDAIPLGVAGRVTGDGGVSHGDAAVNASARDAAVEGRATETATDASGPYTFSEGGSFTSADGAFDRVETLRDFVYVLLLPTLPKLEGTARCTGNGGGPPFS